MISRNRTWFAIVVLASLAANGSSRSPAGAADSRPPTESELVAGLREYPTEIVRSLLTLASDDLPLLNNLAKNPDWLNKPELISPAPSAASLAHVRVLARIPDCVAVATAHPEALAQLASTYKQSPLQVETRASRMRLAYRAARLDGLVAWQRMLESDPRLLQQYAELVTRFCTEQRKQFPGFPVVSVTDLNYYAACPPSDVMLPFLEKNPPADALDQALVRWFSEYAAESIDTRALQETDPSKLPPVPGHLLAGKAPEQRSAMWQRQSSGGVGLLPIIMQPEADQPVDARVAYGVMEHDRLWSPIWLSGQAPDHAEATGVGPAQAAAPLDSPQNLQPSPTETTPPPAPSIARSTNSARVYEMQPIGTADQPTYVRAEDDGYYDDDAIVVREGVYDTPSQQVIVETRPPVVQYTTVVEDYDYRPIGWPTYAYGAFGWPYPYAYSGYCYPWYWYSPSYCYPRYGGYYYGGDSFSFGFGWGRSYRNCDRFYDGFWSPYRGNYYAPRSVYFSLGARSLDRFRSPGVYFRDRGFRGRSLDGIARDRGDGSRRWNDFYTTGSRTSRGSISRTGRDRDGFNSLSGVQNTGRGMRARDGDVRVRSLRGGAGNDRGGESMQPVTRGLRRSSNDSSGALEPGSGDRQPRVRRIQGTSSGSGDGATNPGVSGLRRLNRSDGIAPQRSSAPKGGAGTIRGIRRGNDAGKPGLKSESFAPAPFRSEGASGFRSRTLNPRDSEPRSIRSNSGFRVLRNDAGVRSGGTSSGSFRSSGIRSSGGGNRAAVRSLGGGRAPRQSMRGLRPR